MLELCGGSVSTIIYYIAGLIILVISSFATLIIYRNRNFRGEWILASFLIGVFSLVIGILFPIYFIIRSFLPNVEPYGQLIFIILLYFALSIFYIYLKKEKVLFFAKVLVVSLVFSLLIGAGYYLSATSGSGPIMMIEEVRPDQSQKIKYAEISRNELEGYPSLKNAINEYLRSGKGDTKINYEQQNQINGLIQRKEHNARYLFSLKTPALENDLNNGIASPGLRSIFKNEGYELPDNLIIYNTTDKWDMIEKKQFLFNLTDIELKNELFIMEIGGDIRENSIKELKNVFSSKGIRLSDNSFIMREPEKWIISDEGINYEIVMENGTLGVYSDENKIYEVWKEYGGLNVYDGKNRPGNIFRIDGRYYRISFLWED